MQIAINLTKCSRYNKVQKEPYNEIFNFWHFVAPPGFSIESSQSAAQVNDSINVKPEKTFIKKIDNKRNITLLMIFPSLQIVSEVTVD